VLKALRAHDRRLADELDQLRLSLGTRSKSGGRINLPDNIHLDVPQLLLRDFEQAFYVRTVEQTTARQFRPFHQARTFVHSLGLKSLVEWQQYCKRELAGYDPKPDDIPAAPQSTYKDKGWAGSGDWLGTGTVASQNRRYLSFEEARTFVRSLGLTSFEHWLQYSKSELAGYEAKPDNIPAIPMQTYGGQGWVSVGDWLGTGTIAARLRQYRSFEDARTFVRLLGFKSFTEWRQYCKGELDGYPPKPDDIPANPHNTYRDQGWVSAGDWLGTGTVAPRLRQYRSFEDARTFVRLLGLKSSAEWSHYCAGKLAGYDPKPEDIPAAPQSTYRDQGWAGSGDWLGTGAISNQSRQFQPFKKARSFARSLGLKSETEWRRYCAGELAGYGPRPDDIPSNPHSMYRDQGWVSIGDWLGTGTIASQKFQYRPFKNARNFVRSLGLKSTAEWRRYCNGELEGCSPKPDDIPANPQRTYRDHGWIGIGDWLGYG
jgi:hypothetical protein